MRFLFKLCLVIVAAIAALAAPLHAQSAQQEGFENTTEILDTGILFAIGAREAEQALRSSFGWPTFQEGFVDQVYFRFDPDGYARFSPNPRLDENVFEVVCAGASTACRAQKDHLQIGLTATNQIQLLIQGHTPQDRFFVADETTELPLPPSVLEPLEPRMESLLAAGGNLIIKREKEVINTISLAGLSPVMTYLRWVANAQDSRVFPRGWPVPATASAAQTNALTQPDLWQSPASGTRVTQTTFQNQQNAGLTGIDNFSTEGRNQQTVGSRDFRAQDGTAIQGSGAFGTSTDQSVDFGVNGSDFPNDQNFQALQASISALQAELARLKNQPQVRPDTETQSLSSDPQSVSEVQIRPSIQADYTNKTLADFQMSEIDPQNSVGSIGSVGSSQDLISILNRLAVMEARILRFESDLAKFTHLVDNQLSELREIEAKTNPGSMELNNSAEFAEGLEPTDATSPLEKLLLQRLGNGENLSEDQLSKLEISAKEPTTATDQEALIRQLLQRLEQSEPAANPEFNATSGGSETAAASENGQTQTIVESEGFVTLSDYINQILNSDTAN